MKYAIYDKAADGYLTKMEFEVGYSEHTQFACGITGLITRAHLLDTKEAADSAIANIEGFKFMEKGRFVVHCFDDTLKEHYIISEVGEPTKVVESITVDLDGTINVKYGTMISHWSTASLDYAINRMNALQKAKDPRYTAWCNTFDIYKVIKAIDEKGFVDYQFIKVTEKGLAEYAKDEVDPLNKRIEELEKANRVLDDNVNYHNECRVALADMIRSIKYAIYSKDSDKRASYISYMTDKIKDDETFNRPELKTTKNDIPKICKHLTALAKDPLNKRIEELEKENDNLKTMNKSTAENYDLLKDALDIKDRKLETIKKEASNWKNRYKNAVKDCALLTNVIDNIYDNLGSTDIRKGLKETYEYVESLSELNYIKIHNDDAADGTPIYTTAMSEFKYIIHQMIVIMESLELNQSVAFASADEVHNARSVAYDIISICEEDSKFEITLEKFSQLHEAMNAAYNTDDDPIMHAFNSVLLIFSAMDRKLEDFVDEIFSWKNKAQKAEKALDDQKKLNDANKATIAQMVVQKRAMNKENHELRVARDCQAEIIYAIRNAITDNNSNAFDCIESRMRHDPDFKSDPFMIGARENILDICNACEKNIANNDLKNSEIARLTEERDKALDRAEKFKGIVNSEYGMTIPGRCCGKQVMADILSGKKIPISKDKYDSIITSLKLIDLSYEGVYGTMIQISPKPKPTWLPGLMTELKNLTE